LKELLLIAVLAYAIYDRPEGGYPLLVVLILTGIFFTVTVMIKDRFDGGNNSKTRKRATVRK